MWSCFNMMNLLSLFLLRLFVVSPKTTASVNSGPHIGDVNILLPPKMTHPVEYRLQGTDGCFKWSWDHHDILALLPEYNSSSRCSTSARLKSIAPYSGRKETAVYATDLNTGMVIRCKVDIDIFSRVQIFHSSTKLDLDGLATLKVRAFDGEENVFSSLVGLQFMWQLMPENDGLSHHLVHVPLKDSPQSDCGGLCGDLEIQVKLEDSGVFSDLYVVKGIEIGHGIVSVHLIEPSFEHMEDKITLTVAEAMSLDPPSPVLVLIGAVIHYNLKVLRGNILDVVSLPSLFHRWSALNSSVAKVDSRLGKVHALNLGLTTVIVEDTRVAGHTHTSSLHVVLPDTLMLYILPLSSSGSPIEEIIPISSMPRWYIVSGRKYLIYVKVFSQGGQEIYPTESDEIKLQDDQYEFWNILPVSDVVAVKRNSKILEAIACGLGKVTAALTYYAGADVRNEVIKVVQEVMVCDQVKLSMSKGSSEPYKILLPWAPGINQELELRVTGGCAMASSDYWWVSSGMDIVSVSASGLLQAKNPGKATIRTISVYDPFNYDEIVIEVSTPSLMVMFPVGPQLDHSMSGVIVLNASLQFGAYMPLVSVSKWNLIRVVAPKEILTNSPPLPTKGYLFPVELSDAYFNKHKGLRKGERFFKCTLDPLYVGVVKPWRDLDTGKSYCIFRPYFPEHLVPSAPNNQDLRRGIWISVTASVVGENNISDSASAIFIGGFSLLEANGKSLQLNFTYKGDEAVITVVGNTDVLFRADRRLLSVKTIDKKTNSTGVGYALYQVRVVARKKFTDNMTILLPATGQTMEVDVIYEPENRELSDFQAAMIMFVLILLAGIPLCGFVLEQRGDRVRNQSPAPGASTSTNSGASTFDSYSS